MCIRWLINWSDSTKIHGGTIKFIVHLLVSELRRFQNAWCKDKNVLLFGKQQTCNQHNTKPNYTQKGNIGIEQGAIAKSLYLADPTTFGTRQGIFIYCHNTCKAKTAAASTNNKIFKTISNCFTQGVELLKFHIERNMIFKVAV